MLKKISGVNKEQAVHKEIGLDVLVHGEYGRNDMVEYFGEMLGGFLFTEKGLVPVNQKERKGEFSKWKTNYLRKQKCQKHI